MIAWLLPKSRAGLLSALGRFSLVWLCGLIGTVAAIAGWDRSLGIVMTAALGMPLFFSLRMLSERSKRPLWPAALGAILLLAAYDHWWTPQNANFPNIAGVRWSLIFAGILFFASISGFWRFNWVIFVRLCVAMLYSCVLLAGLLLALRSADQLFNLKIDKGYGYLYFVVAGCVLPVYFLSGIPREFDAVHTEHPRGLKVFTQFALAPLVAVYTVILAAYGIKIIVARNWPNGFVAMPVLILAGMGILCVLLLHPLRSRPMEKWARWFCTAFPWALAPLSLLLLLSMRERIAAYGVTEDRYLGVVSGFWIAAWALVSILRKNAGIRWIPASLAAICLLAALGPWSAGTISRNSQYQRLTKLFRAHGLMIADQFHAPRQPLELPEEECNDASSALHYLGRMHGVESVHRLFGRIWKDIDWANLVDKDPFPGIWVKLNLRSASGQETELHYFLKESDALNLEGFTRATYLEGMIDSPRFQPRGPLVIEHKVLRMKTPDEPEAEAIPVDAFLMSLPQVDGPATTAQMTLNWTQRGRSYRMLFTSLWVKREAGNPPFIGYGAGILYEP